MPMQAAGWFKYPGKRTFHPAGVSTSDRGDGKTIPKDGIKKEDFDEKVSAERAEIRQEILNALHKQESTLDSCPFTMPEMMTMAILCSPSKSVTLIDMMKWMYKNIPFYRDKAVAAYVQSLNLESKTQSQGVTPAIDREMMEDALDCWEAPFSLSEHSIEMGVNSSYGGVVDNICGDDDEVSFTAPVREGRIFLRRW
jgi:hypothetical protein